jgi:hemoglobin
MEKEDIVTFEDVKCFVNAFYSSVRQDPMLSVIFNERIQDRWPEHLEKMYRFWQTVLFEEHTYFGAPFPPHATLNVRDIHFNRWIELFTITIDQFFIGSKAQEAKWRGQKMAQVFVSKINNGR